MLYLRIMDLKTEENMINGGHPKLYFHAKKKKLGRSDFPSTKSTHELFSPLGSRITIELVIYTSQDTDKSEINSKLFLISSRIGLDFSWFYAFCLSIPIELYHFMQRRRSPIDLSTTKSHSSSLPTRSEKKSSVELHLRANPNKTLRPRGKQK
ncbi:hypothetical protein V1478_010584 [Vespula squamosa]|uniref:Uncharacterized protein n=1 Tax=Vespula squamosa TaxID=30214 RepID=A0ABD2AI64_VESSQ